MTERVDLIVFPRGGITNRLADADRRATTDIAKVDRVRKQLLEDTRTECLILLSCI